MCFRNFGGSILKHGTNIKTWHKTLSLLIFSTSFKWSMDGSQFLSSFLFLCNLFHNEMLNKLY